MDKNEIKKYYEKLIINKINKEGLFGDPKDDLYFMSLPIDYSKRPLKCIELGYGTGRYVEYLAEKGVLVTAVDLIDKSLLINRVDGKKYRENITIIQRDIESFGLNDISFDIVIVRNVLHYLPRESVEQTILELIKHTNEYGVHYITLFTDIIRYDWNGNAIFFPGEAQYSLMDAMDYIYSVYVGWNISIKVEKYRELDESGLFNYFTADCIYIIAQKSNNALNLVDKE